MNELNREEKLNNLSYTLRAILVILGIIFLLFKKTQNASYTISTVLLYGLTLVSMFGISAAYHYTRDFYLKRILRVLDHINIYFLIVGTHYAHLSYYID